MRAIPLVGAIFCVALATGCTDSVDHLDGDATPVGAASPSAAASAAPSLSASAPTPAPSTSAQDPSPPPTTGTKPVTTPARSTVLGPKGLGGLALGMTHRQAVASGQLSTWKGKDLDGCTQPAHLRGASGKTAGDDGMVYYSTSLGIQIIDGYPGLHTPEGIKIGSSLAAARKAYPGLVDVANDPSTDTDGDGRAMVPVPGNPKAVYRIVTIDSKVVQLTLQLAHQSCYE